MKKNAANCQLGSQNSVYQSVYWERSRRHATRSPLEDIRKYQKIDGDYVDKASAFKIELHLNGPKTLDITALLTCIDTDINDFVAELVVFLKLKYPSEYRNLFPIINVTASGFSQRSSTVIMLVQFQKQTQVHARHLLDVFVQTLSTKWGRQEPAIPLSHDDRPIREIIDFYNSNINDLTGAVGLKAYVPSRKHFKKPKKSRERTLAAAT